MSRIKEEEEDSNSSRGSWEESGELGIEVEEGRKAARYHMMWSLWQAAFGGPSAEAAGGGVEFWSIPERAGWLTKQGEHIKTWRRRWFVLKQGKLFWFKEPLVTRASAPRGVVLLASCVSVKGAEDVIHRSFSFEISTTRGDTMYFVADSDKDKEEWISSIGRAIVQRSRSVADQEVLDYDTNRQR